MHARMIGTVVCLCILSLVYSELLLYLGLLRRGSTAIDYSLFVYTNLVKISHTQIFSFARYCPLNSLYNFLPKAPWVAPGNSRVL